MRPPYFRSPTRKLPIKPVPHPHPLSSAVVSVPAFIKSSTILARFHVMHFQWTGIRGYTLRLSSYQVLVARLGRQKLLKPTAPETARPNVYKVDVKVRWNRSRPATAVDDRRSCHLCVSFVTLFRMLVGTHSSRHVAGSTQMQFVVWATRGSSLFYALARCALL